MEKKRLSWVETVQLLSMFLVVLHHSIPNGYSINSVFLSIASSVHYPALTTFFFCSGYLSYDYKKYGYKAYLYRRCKRLILPFVVVNLIMIVPKLLIIKITTGEIEYSFDLLIRSFLNPHGEGICPHLWYLPTLMLMGMFLPIVDAIVKKKGKYVIIIISLLVSLSILPYTFTTWLCINELRMYFCFFVIGYVARDFRLMDKIENQTGILFIISTALVILLISYKNSICIFQFLISAVGAISLLSLSILIEDRFGRLRSFFRNKTFCIYILSLCFQNFVEVLGCHYINKWWITSGVMFIVGIIAPIVVYQFFKFLKVRYAVPPMVLQAFGID